jgi:hypothetical protein
MYKINNLIVTVFNVKNYFNEHRIFINICETN